MSEQQRKLLAIIQKDPERILNSRKLFEAAMKHLLRIVSRAGLVPMIPNNTQKMVLDAYFEQKQSGKPVRIIILKGRQQGSSTICGAILMIEMLCRSNLTTLVCSEKKGGSAKNLFSKYKVFIENYPEFESTLSVKARTRVFRGDSNFELLNGSNLRVEGQGDVVSYTNEILHLSEASRFTEFETFLGSCLQGTEELEGTGIFIESTAYAYGDGFHNQWQRAKGGLSNFIPVFAPWYIHERNTMALPDDEDEREAFINSIGQYRDRYGDEGSLVDQYGLNYNQLFWRRERIDNSCQGSMDMFKREYPSNDIEAFMAQDTPVLHTRSLEWYRDRAEPSKKIGYMLPDIAGKREDGTQKAEFLDSVHGAFEIWDEPHPYREYIVGSDHAEGLPTGDFNAGLVAQRLPFKIVAKLRGNDASKLDEVSYAKQLYYILRWYNNAYVLPENNTHGNTVVNTLNEWEYPNIMYERDVYPDAKSKRMGWQNNKATSKHGIEVLYDALRLDFTRNPEGELRSEWAPIIPDMQTIEECQHIVWKGVGQWGAKRKGDYRAPGSSAIGCYDDLVIALMTTVLGHQALPRPKTEDELKLEIHGPDHQMTDHIPYFIADQYRDPDKSTYASEHEWWGHL